MNFPGVSTRPATRRRRSLRPSLEAVEARQMLSGTVPIYVLGDNGNLWFESSSWQTTGRTEVDSDVKAFVPTVAGDVYVLGTNGNLWLEGANWQKSGRTFVDSGVQAFATVLTGDPDTTTGAGDLYVLETNGNLWQEGPGWQTGGRTLIDSTVKTFAADTTELGGLYVEGTNGNLWWEYLGWQTNGDGRTFIDSDVKAFAPDRYTSGFVEVLGDNGNLWVESFGWQTSPGGRTLLYSNVAAFAYDPNTEDEWYVLFTNNNLVLEPPPGITTVSPMLLDDNVAAFASDPYVISKLYVLDTNGNLWLEDPYSVSDPFTYIDSDVAGFAPGGQVNPTADPSFTTTNNVTVPINYAPPPAGAQLFNNGQPSYLDVEQGQVGDCWLLAGLAEVAARDPKAIENMFTYDGTTVDNGSTVGLYTVRFYNTSGVAVYVQVDTELPQYQWQNNGEAYPNYAQVGNWLGTQALWVALAEKGYAEANGLGDVTTTVNLAKGWDNEYQDAYIELTAGNSMASIQAITGDSVSQISINPTDIGTAWNAGEFIALNTSLTAAPPNSDIVGDHEYALVGYNASSSTPFEIYNPWGTTSATPTGWAPGYAGTAYGLFNASAATVSQNFVNQDVGTEAINVKHVDGPVNALTESAALGDGYARSATIRVDRFRPSFSGVDTATSSNLPLISPFIYALQDADIHHEGRASSKLFGYDRFARPGR